jgi:hypothetical protein
MECGNDRLGGVHDANEQIQEYVDKVKFIRPVFKFKNKILSYFRRF